MLFRTVLEHHKYERRLQTCQVNAMRDVLLLLIVGVSVPISFLRPYYGILVWTWITFFNPHRFTWGFMYDAPVAAVIAVPTLLGCLFTPEINRQIFKRETVLLLILWTWFLVTFFYATQVPLFQGHILDAKRELIRISKVLLITFTMIVLVTNRVRFKYLVVVTALCFAVLSLKSAIFGLRTAGEARIWGPPDSFITDNNAFALALNVSLPMLYFLAREESRRAYRIAWYVAFACGILCVILSY